MDARKDPGRIARAWCELRGGHRSEALGAWFPLKTEYAFGAKAARASAFALYCKRCGRQTKWFAVPTRELAQDVEPPLVAAIEAAGLVLAAYRADRLAAKTAMDRLIPILDNEAVARAMRERRGR